MAACNCWTNGPMCCRYGHHNFNYVGPSRLFDDYKPVTVEYLQSLIDKLTPDELAKLRMGEWSPPSLPVDHETTP